MGRARAFAAALACIASAACSAEPADEGSSTTAPTGTDGDGSTTSAADGSFTGSGASTGGSSGDDSGTTTTADTTETTGASVCDEPPDPAPDWLGSYQMQIVAALSGAAEISPGVTLSDRATPQRRAATVAYVVERFTEQGLEPLEHDYGDGTNVHAVLTATEPGDTYLVVGAHFDTVPQSPGANDNATGVALVLALARYLGELDCRSQNVIFVLFDQEEVGLVGSYEYARLLDEQGLDVVAVHTIDQMGWDGDGDRAVELERADAGLFEFYEAVASGLVPPVPLTPTQTGFTDHVSFREWGFAAVGLTEEFVSGDTSPHYHMPSDTYETVDFAYLASTTALANLAFAEALTP